MPRDTDREAIDWDTRDGGDFRGKGGNLRLLRTSHIYASAVREILERNPLQKTSSLPLSASQLYLLKLVSQNGHHQVGEAADFLGVSPPAATKTIDKLERLGLVVRTPSEGDRRATLLSVSRKGRRLVRKFEKLVLVPLHAALAGFAPDEVELLARLLERLAISLLEAEEAVNEPGACLRCAAYVESDCPIGHVHGGCPFLKVRGDHRNNRTRTPSDKSAGRPNPRGESQGSLG